MVERQRHEYEQVKPWTSDFAKAYREVAQMVEQLHLTVVAQWYPQEKKVVSIVSAGQLFGETLLRT